MPISDRDRKILWGLAGNQCAMCRAELVQQQPSGTLALVGDECHIVSPRPDGPRGTDTPGPDPELDRYSNLILLCAVDHRRIDQLPEEFPVEALLAIKSAHELWQRARRMSVGPTEVVLKRGASPYLRELQSARDVLGILVGAEESSLNNEEVVDADEAQLVGGFLQNALDWSEIWDDIGPAARVDATLAVTTHLRSLREQGWRVFGGRATGRLEGGVAGRASLWTTAYLEVVRSDSAAIIDALAQGEAAGDDPLAEGATRLKSGPDA